MPDIRIFKHDKYEVREKWLDFPNTDMSPEEAKKCGPVVKEAFIDGLPVSKEKFFESFKKDFPNVDINHLK